MKKINNQKQQIKFLWSVFILIFCQISYAQELRISETAETKIVEDLTADQKSQIMSSVTSSINKYNTYASLFDKEKEKVTEDYIDKFRLLFHSNAKIYQDYREYPKGLIEDTEYAEEVYNLLRSQGVQYIIKRATLRSIEYDFSGYYKVTVDVEKYLFNYVTTEGEILTSESGRYFPLSVVFDIPQNDLAYAPIIKINTSIAIEPPADYTTTIGVFGSGSYILNSPQLTDIGEDLFENSTNNSNFSAFGETPIMIGGGLEFTTNQFINPKKAVKKPLFLRLGVQWQQLQMNAELLDYSYEYNESHTSEGADLMLNNDLGIDTYTRMVYIQNFSESLTINFVQGIVGLEFELFEKNYTSIRIGTGWQPSFAIAANSKINGKANYDGLLDDTQVRFLREGSGFDNIENRELFEIGEQVISLGEESPGNPKELNLDTQLQNQFYGSLSLKKDLTSSQPIIGLLIDVTYNFHLNSFIDHEKTDTPERILNFSERIDNSLFQDFYSDVKAHNVGLKIGVYYKIITKP